MLRLPLQSCIWGACPLLLFCVHSFPVPPQHHERKAERHERGAHDVQRAGCQHATSISFAPRACISRCMFSALGQAATVARPLLPRILCT